MRWKTRQISELGDAEESWNNHSRLTGFALVVRAFISFLMLHAMLLFS